MEGHRIWPLALYDVQKAQILCVTIVTSDEINGDPVGPPAPWFAAIIEMENGNLLTFSRS